MTIPAQRVALALACLVAFLAVPLTIAVTTEHAPAARADATAGHRAGLPAPAGRSPAAASGRAPRVPRVGADVSWPQCRRGLGLRTHRGLGLPMPGRGADFVVLGLTNGPAFHPNPCLAAQVQWVRRHHLHAAAYAVVSYPRRRELRRYGDRGPFGRGGLVRRVSNTGHAQAEFNVRAMRRAGLSSPMVWLDVEPFSRTPWSRHARVNRALLHGVVHAYRAHGLRVGVYSTGYLWRVAVGRARPGLPEWRTVGPSSPRAARRACGRGSFQGGGAVLVQWWTRSRDHDLVCPRHATAEGARRWFHRY